MSIKISSRIALMMGVLSSMFASKAHYKSEIEKSKPGGNKFQSEPKQPKGKRHRTFGKEITSIGTKPEYGHLARKLFYAEKDQQRRIRHAEAVERLREKGIIWTPFGLFWKDRKVAEAHR